MVIMVKEPEHVAVICGGDSAEREVSLKTGNAVAEALEESPAEVSLFDTEVDLGSRLRQAEVDVAFVALHGRGGEDGVIQGMLEWHGIPYTGPGVAASSICMDKIYTKFIVEQLQLPTPDWFILEADEAPVCKQKFERLVVKPRCEGSSIGLSIVEADELSEAVEAARRYDSEVLVEEYIEGYEVTVGAVTLDQFELLPPVGIRPSHEFFDFETKYTKGLTEYDVPAPLDREVVEKLRKFTRRAVTAFQTKSLCRVDYLLDKEEDPKLLEINTIPGMTATSLLPMAAEAAGTDFPELIWGLVCRALEGYK